MSRRRVVVFAAVAAVLLIVVASVLTGSRGGKKRDDAARGRASTARAGIAAHATKRTATSWLAQRGAPERRVAGRVVAAGSPVAGAEVRLARRAHRDVLKATVITGADGTFDFGLHEAARVVVAATAEGKAGAVMELDLRDPTESPDPGSLVIALRPCDASVYGFVLDAGGGAIAGATVRRGPIEVVAAADGAYSLCVPIGETVLEVGADGYGTVAITFAVTNRVRRDFRLSPEGVVVGRAVRADDGTPVADAVVSLQAASVMPGMTTTLAGAAGRTTTDGDGRFRLDGVVPGRRQIVGAADGLRSRAVDVNVVAGEADEEVTVPLEPTAVVLGRVVDERGEGVAGASVMFADQDRTRFRDVEATNAVSQHDGTFELGGLRPGAYELSVRPFRIAGAKQERVVDVPSAGLPDLTIVVARGAKVSGVVTRGGKPVGGARVNVRGDGRGQVLSDAAGRFTLRGVVPGTHELYAESMADGAFSRGPTITVNGDADLDGVIVDLALAGSIAGVVVDQHGAPVSGAYLSFRIASGGDFGESTTAEDGTFKARALSGGGDYHVQITQSRRSSMKFAPVSRLGFPPVAVADGYSQVEGVRYEVVVDRLTIAGTVVDERGKPLPDVRVEAGPDEEFGFEWGEVPTDVTDADGKFTITNLLAGNYRVDARAGSGAQASAPDAVAAGTRNLKLVLATPGRIEGTLAGFPGRPRVTARQMMRGGRRMMLDGLNAEVTGTSFRIRGVAPGRYVVAGIAGGVVGDEKTIEVSASETERVTLTYRGVGSVDGTVTDGEGTPMAGVRCTLMNANARNGAESDANGAFTIASASVGTTMVICHDPERSAMGYGAVTVEAGKAATVAVTILRRADR